MRAYLIEMALPFRAVFGLLIFVFLLGFFSCANNIAHAENTMQLPVIEGWESSEAIMTNLASVSGDRGFMEERTYRTPSGIRIRAILMRGSGMKLWSIPAAGTASSDGALGNGSVYESLIVAEKKAVFERHPLLGVSLVVDLGGAIMTLESGDRDIELEEMAAVAGQLMAEMR